MIGIVTKTTYNGRPVRLHGIVGLRTYQMLDLGWAGVNSIKDRVSRGVGSSDAAMPPLKAKPRKRYDAKQKKCVEFGESARSGYKARKVLMGLKPIRDLAGPGVGWTGKGQKRRERRGPHHMLDDLRVTSASATEARIDITKEDSRMKARANEQRAPWYGFSGKDLRNILELAQKMFDGNVSELEAQFHGPARGGVTQMPGSIQSRTASRAGRMAA